MAQPDGIPRVIHGGAQAVFQDFVSLGFFVGRHRPDRPFA